MIVPRAVRLVWRTSPRLTLVLAGLSLAAGALPAGVAYLGKLIVDAVVLAAETGDVAHRDLALTYVGGELLLVAALTATQRAISVCRSLLRAQLGHRVNVLILEKALTLELSHFEDAELYDKMTRARREASSRPLSLVMRSFGVAQDGISLASYAALLIPFSPWAVAALVVAALPSFVAETRFSGEAFRLFRWRTPETRQQGYLEMVIAREDHAKEVMVFGLGPRLVERYKAIFDKLYGEDRNLTMRRGAWGVALGLVSTVTFYAAYAWIAVSTIAGLISLGEMTMYLLVFKQGQSALSSVLTAMGGMYEDQLYLSNLYEFLEEPVRPTVGDARIGAVPGDGVRFDHVTFLYPGSDRPAVEDVSFHIPPGRKLALVGENGSGKTTLIKLLTRLYEPTHGSVSIDGTDIRDWDIEALRARIAVIFQDFVRYQMIVGENIGAGDPEAFADERRWERAARAGLAAPFIEDLPDRYHTQLGRWFHGGRELSLGQWQKMALARAFAREGADILVLDEPTASMDAAAEVEIFEHFGEHTAERIAILISHRFSTVRMADEILVLERGRVLEQGSHDELLALDGHYARLFRLQAAGYR